MVSSSTLKLYKWAESDQKFLKNLTLTSMDHISSCYSTSFDGNTVWPIPASVDRIKSRQRFLRSYKFSTTGEERKAVQKTKNFLRKKKHYLKKKISRVFSSTVRIVKTKCDRLHMSGGFKFLFRCRAKHQLLIEI
ncbi:hypothetical protein L1987_68338 [Smallanthus sonchifolius]|uniref:Uncharacterized protein n=1 Tax=Smallanthus sonchifolius TaxID=185202 RepID=A0ACB9B4M8_9ASTR|nr:hypothetical protein L1987_68338 [Smallanthus sonchifolius]